MSLLGRINGDDVTETVGRLPIHQFLACLHEYARGELTSQQILDEPKLAITEDDMGHYNFIKKKIDA